MKGYKKGSEGWRRDRMEGRRTEGRKRLGLGLEYMAGTVIPLGFFHNPARTIRTRKVTSGTPRDVTKHWYAMPGE